jgi:prepilin-type N-terminal cleavage/methylation domain-containing protein/prepilin-type processing-associated H-X9-DG protein
MISKPDPSSFPPVHPGRMVRSGFTLVELLVVILIIVALAAVSMIAIRGGLAKADHSKCLNNVKQLVAATVVASTDLNGRFPDMEGPSGPWMQDVLWPYVSGNAPKPGSVPVKNSIFTCPAAQKNKQQKWMRDGVQYRYNSFTAPGKTPLYDWSQAVVIFDKHWGDWPVHVWSHFPGAQARVNVGYADGHVAAMSYEEYRKVCSWGGSVESYCPIYQKGWKE